MPRHQRGIVSVEKSAPAPTKSMNRPEPAEPGAELVHCLNATRKLEPAPELSRQAQNLARTFDLSLGALIMLPVSHQDMRQADDPQPGQSQARTRIDRDYSMSMMVFSERIRSEKRDTGVRVSRRIPEVVRVFDLFQLIDAESYQRTYSRKNCMPLPNGYYVVTWPHGMDAMTFGDVAEFEGPYRFRRDAEIALEKGWPMP